MEKNLCEIKAKMEQLYIVPRPEVPLEKIQTIQAQQKIRFAIL